MSGWAAVAQIAGEIGNWALNHWENNRQQHFEHDEAALNRYWQSQEAEKARDWQSREWQRQFDATNAYNTPSAQKQRYLEGGINPWLAQSSVGSGSASPQAMPSTTVPTGSKANASSFSRIADVNFGEFLLKKSSVDAQNSNQRAQAFKTAVEAASQLWKASPSMAKNYLASVAKQYGEDQDSFNKFDREFEYKMVGLDADNVRKLLENSLIDQYGEKKAQLEIDSIDQSIVESAARIGKMASDAELNDAKIKEVASSMARNFAEAGYFNANAHQINALLEFVSKKMSVELGRLSMQFLTEHGDFLQNTKVRDWQGTEKAQNARLYTNSMSSDNNVVGKFMKEFLQNVPSPLWNNAFDSYMQKYQFGNYMYR